MPSDLRTFRRLTLGKPCIMGRKTFQSIGRPLDGRHNIVVTRDSGWQHEGVTVARTLPEALQLAAAAARTKGGSEVMVIGGGEVYAAALALADRIYLTEVQAAPEGDARFPLLDPTAWREVAREPIATTDRDDHAATLIVYERRVTGPAVTPP
jgi:dihydrofolate reductase